MENLSPQRIMETGMAFWPAKTLLTAIKLGLFAELGAGKQTGKELQSTLGLHDRANPDFFDTLVALKFLEREGDGESAKYSNTPETAVFLDRNSPAFIGGFLEMAHDRLYPFWGDLHEGLRTGKAQNETKHGGTGVFEELYSKPERLEQFMDAMAGISYGNFATFAEKFDFSNYKTMVDVGGATGLLSTLVVKANPHMTATTADLPGATEIAKRKIEAAGVADSVSAGNIDFFKDPIPSADVVTMGMILHDWNLKNKMMLIQKAYDALPEGGAFVAIENIIDDARRENAFGLMMSLNMLIEFGEAFDFTHADFDKWCREVGFTRTECIHLAGPASAVIAYK
ncbi:MAG TPA: methyltransferase [Pyrinomonadaceae bacterium]|nr:methyltransferase [Pyrinomonadaceae bacterium]